MEGCVKAITTWSQEETMYTIIQSFEIKGVFIQTSSHLQRLFGECMLESKCSNYCIKLHSLINFYKVLYNPSFGGIMLLFSICSCFLALFYNNHKGFWKWIYDFKGVQFLKITFAHGFCEIHDLHLWHL